MRSLLIALVFYSVPSLAQERLPFDRVFTSPQQRQMLEQIREDGEEAQTDISQQIELAPTPETQTVTFSGYVRRSDGSQVLFIDGQSDFTRDLGEAGTQRAVLLEGNESVTFQARERSTQLKPGQVWLLDEDEVVESYEVASPEVIITEE